MVLFITNAGSKFILLSKDNSENVFHFNFRTPEMKNCMNEICNIFPIYVFNYILLFNFSYSKTVFVSLNAWERLVKDWTGQGNPTHTEDWKLLSGFHHYLAGVRGGIVSVEKNVSLSLYHWVDNSYFNGKCPEWTVTILYFLIYIWAISLIKQIAYSVHYCGRFSVRYNWLKISTIKYSSCAEFHISN